MEKTSIEKITNVKVFHIEDGKIHYISDYTEGGEYGVVLTDYAHAFFEKSEAGTIVSRLHEYGQQKSDLNKDAVRQIKLLFESLIMIDELTPLSLSEVTEETEDGKYIEF